MLGVETRQAGAGLVHVDAVHAQFLDRALGQAGVFIPPEGGAHAHRRAGLAGEGVIDFRVNLAVRAFDGEPRGGFIGPAWGGHAPEPLVHIHQGADVFGLRAGQGVGETLGALAGRQVFRETGVVGAAMPPVPEDADRQVQFFPQNHRRFEHARRAAAVPDPQRGVKRPVGHPAARQPAFPGPGLVGCPGAVALGGCEPVAGESPELDGVRQAPGRDRCRAALGQVRDFAVQAVFAVAEERKVFVEPGGIVAGHIQPRPILLVKRQALQGQMAGIAPLEPPPVPRRAGKDLARLGGEIPHPCRHGQPLVGLARDVYDARKADVGEAQCIQTADRQFPVAHGLPGVQPHHRFHAQFRRRRQSKLFPGQAQPGGLAVKRLGAKGLRG